MLKETLDLSPEARDIINRYVGTSAAASDYKRLLVSLYAGREDADADVVVTLRGNLSPLSGRLTSEEIERLQSEYAAVALYCQRRLAWGKPDESLDDRSNPLCGIAELCIREARCSAGDTVLMYSAGYCSFALWDEAPCRYDVVADTAEDRAWARLLLASQGKAAKISKSMAKGRRYNRIFAFPPLSAFLDTRSAVPLLRRMAREMLETDGSLFCLLPAAFCDSAAWLPLRRALLDGGLSVTVITLPPMFAPYTPANLCLLHVENNSIGAVRLLDATGSELVSVNKELGLRTFLFNTIGERLSSIDDKLVWSGFTDDISDARLILRPSRYLVKGIQPKGAGAGSLGELLDFLPRRRERIEKASGVIGMSELSFSASCGDTVPRPVTAPQGSWTATLSEDALLVGFIGGKFKVGRAHGLTPPVALRAEVLAFRVKEPERVDTDFLLRALLSGNVREQGRMLATGSVIPRLALADLQSIRVSVPTMAEQVRACREAAEGEIAEARTLLRQADDEFRRDVHMKKHAIGQTVFTLSNWLGVLERARREGKGVVSDTAEVGTLRKTRVADIYGFLRDAVEKLQTQVSRFDAGWGMRTETIDLAALLAGYVRQNPQTLFTYELRGTGDETAGGSGNGPSAGGYQMTFPREALVTVLDNIVSNAASHAFAPRPEGRNIVRIELAAEGGDFIVTVSNNGLPLTCPPEDVFTYGRSSREGHGHYGIGGYEVRRLMREFGGEAEILARPGEEFPVAYRLTFRNTDIA